MFNSRLNNHVHLTALFLTLIILSTSTFQTVQAQTVPSTQGFQCGVSVGSSQNFISYHVNPVSGVEKACSLYTSSGIGGNLSFVSATAGSCTISDSNGNTGSIGAFCNTVAVCLTGLGYVAADSSGFCPDPNPTGDEGDDDDNDGNICDTGEEKELDCNQSDTDSDGDGEPDSQDDNDGKCSSFNDDDADCDNVCGENDDPDSVDCSGGNCKKEEIGEYETFLVSEYPNSPPQLFCGELNNCQLERCGGYDFRFAIDTPEEARAYQYCQNGKQCSGTENTSDSTDCPVGETFSTTSNTCENVPNFCELDDDNDGIPDHDSSFACQPTNQCDPLNETCDIGSAGLAACDQQTPPSCDGDPIQCASLDLQWQTTCGVKFTSVFECDSEFICSGNPLECAQTELDRANYCAFQLTQEQKDDEESLSNFQDGVDDGANYLGGDGVAGSTVDLSNGDYSFDDSGFGLSRQCISDISVNTPLGDLNIPLSVLCSVFQIAGQIILIFGFFFASRIVGSSF